MVVSLLGWEPPRGSTRCRPRPITLLTRAGGTRGQPSPSSSGLFVGGGKAERTRQDVARAAEGGARTRPGRRSRPCRRAAAHIGRPTPDYSCPMGTRRSEAFKCLGQRHFRSSVRSNHGMQSGGNENQVVRPSPGAPNPGAGAMPGRCGYGGAEETAPAAFSAGSVVPGADASRMLRAFTFLLFFFLTERFGGFGTEGAPEA